MITTEDSTGKQLKIIKFGMAENLDLDQTLNMWEILNGLEDRIADISSLIGPSLDTAGSCFSLRKSENSFLGPPTGAANSYREFWVCFGFSVE